MVARFSIAFLLGVPMACFAHVGSGPHTALQGFWHPVSGLDHLVTLLAVGWMVAHGLSRRGTISIPVAFLSGMFAGIGFGVVGFSVASMEYGIALSVVAMGCLVALAVESRYIWAFMIIAGFYHGLAHGSEMPASSNALEFLGGLLASSAAMLFLGLQAHRRFSGSVALPAIRYTASALLVFAGFHWLLGAA